MTVTTYSANRRAELTVSDEGPGIPQRVQRRIFERFYTADTAGGSGLGLAIARELAQRMNGRITITSSRRFTAFTLDLPPGPASAGAARPHEPGQGGRVRRAALASALLLCAGPARRLRLRSGNDGDGQLEHGGRRRSDRREPEVVDRDLRPRLRRRPGLRTRRRPAWSRSARSSAAGARRGLRLRPRHRRRDRHQRPRRHRRIRAASASRPKQVYVEFPDRNVVPAKIVGFDPFADVALLAGRARRARPAPAGARRRPRPRRRPAGGGDRQPLRRAAVALGRGRLGDRPLGPVADPVPDRGRDPDRRLDQPRQLRRAAARRRRPGGRHQPADRDRTPAPTTGSASRSRSRRSSARSPSCEEDGKAEYAYIGVSSQALYPQLADKLGLDTDFGGLIAEVVPGGPADEGRASRAATTRSASRAAQYRTGGDVILSVDGHKVARPDDLARSISAFQPGDQVTLRSSATASAKRSRSPSASAPTGSPAAEPPRRRTTSNRRGPCRTPRCFRKSPSATSPSPTTPTSSAKS